MKRSRAVGLMFWCGLGAGASSCAQLVGISEDYELGGSGNTRASGGAQSNTGGMTTGVGVGAGGAKSSGGGPGAAGEPSGGGGAPGASAAGPTTITGEGGEGGGASGAGGDSAAGPVRIGFSEFHDSAFGSDNASSHLTDASFVKPPDTRAGDLILVFFGSDHTLLNLSGTSLTETGWTLIDQHSEYGTDGQGAYLIYKIAGPSEPDPIVFPGINSLQYGNGVQGLLAVYRGVHPTMPINAYDAKLVAEGAVGVTEASSPTPPITTTVPNCLLLAGLSPDTTIDLPVVSSWPEGFVENQVSVINPPNPYPLAWANIYTAERHLARATSVPASAFVFTTGSQMKFFGSLAFVLALAPAP